VAARQIVKLHTQVQVQQQPFIHASFRFDEDGLSLLGTPTEEEWSQCLDRLLHIEDNVRFWIGDLLVYGVSRWGEEAVQEMVEASGYDYKSLDVFRWVASRIEASRRWSTLSFSHHQAVASLPVDQQEFLLARAEDEGWTSKAVRREVRRLGCETKRPDSSPLPSGLHHGDCRAVMATLPDESVDLLLTHPPADGPKAVAVIDDVLRSASAKLKPNSHIYVFTTWETYDGIFALLETHFDLSNALIWVQTDGEQRQLIEVPADHQILFAQKGRRHLNGSRDGDVLYYAPVPGHPVEKPVALLQYLIEKSTQEHEIVLDPFMATGSTCLAASIAGRGYIGIESDRQRYEEAQRRLASTAGV
jgi:DNA modification methylase